MAFEIKDGVLRTYVPETGAAEVTRLKSVRRIYDRAFYGCKVGTAA